MTALTQEIAAQVPAWAGAKRAADDDMAASPAKKTHEEIEKGKNFLLRNQYFIEEYKLVI